MKSRQGLISHFLAIAWFLANVVSAKMGLESQMCQGKGEFYFKKPNQLLQIRFLNFLYITDKLYNFFLEHEISK